MLLHSVWVAVWLDGTPFGLVKCEHVPENHFDSSYTILCKMCTLDETEQHCLSDDNYLLSHYLQDPESHFETTFRPICKL